jgi:AP2-associated kinase
MHDCSPPVVHRDIKVENVLMSGKVFKLCDFGSANTEVIDLQLADRATILECEETFER